VVVVSRRHGLAQLFVAVVRDDRKRGSLLYEPVGIGRLRDGRQVVGDAPVQAEPSVAKRRRRHSGDSAMAYGAPKSDNTIRSTNCALHHDVLIDRRRLLHAH
jgi:hypothetical protein